MEDKVVGSSPRIDPMDELVGGQPRWYWALPLTARKEVLRERAEKSGAEYVRDGSKAGLKEDGEPPPREKAKRLEKGAPRMTKARREAIERRAAELLKKGRGGET